MPWITFINLLKCEVHESRDIYNIYVYMSLMKVKSYYNSDLITPSAYSYFSFSVKSHFSYVNYSDTIEPLEGKSRRPFWAREFALYEASPLHNTYM